MVKFATLFPELSEEQISQLDQLNSLYSEWNDKINVVSRKDIDQLNTRHVLHSMALYKVASFEDGSTVLDVGTGGGFPGIPLAIAFPNVQFKLLDSIKKKTAVVQGVADALQLENVEVIWDRSENIVGVCDYIISRAVTALPGFLSMTKQCYKLKGRKKLYYLKGGDFEDELKQIKRPYKLYNIDAFFDDSFFETKKIVEIKIK